VLIESLSDLFSLTTDQLLSLRLCHADAGRPADVARINRAIGYLKQAQALSVETERVREVEEQLLDVNPGRHGTGEEDD
jgi:hypothetical protein